LKEKDFREHLKKSRLDAVPRSICGYQLQYGCYSSSFSILVAIQVAPYAKKTVDGSIEDLEASFMKNCWPKLIILSTPIKQL
jgi:hypothetical protein